MIAFFIPFSYSAGIILHIVMILSLDFEPDKFKFRNVCRVTVFLKIFIKVTV